MNTSAAWRNAIQLNETLRKLEDASRALGTLRTCLEHIEGAGACCPPSDFATVGVDLNSIWERLGGEGEVVAGISRAKLDRRTLAGLPDDTLARLRDLNRCVARLEERLARWLLLETDTPHQYVLHGKEVRTGTWLTLPCSIDLVVEFHDLAHGPGGNPSPPKLKLRLSGVDCQFRHPGATNPSRAIRVKGAAPSPESIEADPDEDAHDICGLLRAIRQHGGVGWVGMWEIAVVTARLPGHGTQFVVLMSPVVS
jgi:hypothetical protein